MVIRLQPRKGKKIFVAAEVVKFREIEAAVHFYNKVASGHRDKYFIEIQ